MSLESFDSISAKPPPSLSCTFSPGDGSGGIDVKIGSQQGSECVTACMRMKVNDNSINGVTVYQNQRAGCWCEKGMTGVRGSTTFKPCRLLPKTSGN